MPEPITEGKVVGRILYGRATTTITDPHPDYPPAPDARCEFRALLPEGRMKALMNSDPTSVFLMTFIADTDDDGYLIDPAGNRGMLLPASVDPTLHYSEWLWELTVRVPGVPPIVSRFVLPEWVKAGDEVDVTSLTSVPVEPGRELAYWEALYLRIHNLREVVRAEGESQIADITAAGAGVEARAVLAATAAAESYTVRAEAAQGAAVAARDESRSASSAAATEAGKAFTSAQAAATSAASISKATTPVPNSVPVRDADGRVPGVVAPAADQDAANKKYVDDTVTAAKPNSAPGVTLTPVAGFTNTSNPCRYAVFGDMVILSVGLNGTFPTGETTVIPVGGIPAEFRPMNVASGGGRGDSGKSLAVEVFADGSVMIAHANTGGLTWCRASVTYRRKTA